MLQTIAGVLFQACFIVFVVGALVLFFRTCLETLMTDADRERNLRFIGVALVYTIIICVLFSLWIYAVDFHVVWDFGNWHGINTSGELLPFIFKPNPRPTPPITPAYFGTWISGIGAVALVVFPQSIIRSANLHIFEEETTTRTLMRALYAVYGIGEIVLIFLLPTQESSNGQGGYQFWVNSHATVNVLTILIAIYSLVLLVFFSSGDLRGAKLWGIFGFVTKWIGYGLFMLAFYVISYTLVAISFVLNGFLILVIFGILFGSLTLVTDLLRINLENQSGLAIIGESLVLSTISLIITAYILRKLGYLLLEKAALSVLRFIGLVDENDVVPGVNKSIRDILNPIRSPEDSK